MQGYSFSLSTWVEGWTAKLWQCEQEWRQAFLTVETLNHGLLHFIYKPALFIKSFLKRPLVAAAPKPRRDRNSELGGQKLLSLTCSFPFTADLVPAILPPWLVTLKCENLKSLFKLVSFAPQDLTRQLLPQKAPEWNPARLFPLAMN